MAAQSPGCLAVSHIKACPITWRHLLGVEEMGAQGQAAARSVALALSSETEYERWDSGPSMLLGLCRDITD